MKTVEETAVTHCPHFAFARSDTLCQHQMTAMSSVCFYEIPSSNFMADSRAQPYFAPFPSHSHVVTHCTSKSSRPSRDKLPTIPPLRPSTHLTLRTLHVLVIAHVSLFQLLRLQCLYFLHFFHFELFEEVFDYFFVCGFGTPLCLWRLAR